MNFSFEFSHLLWVLDIVLVSFLIYRILLLVKGTRAMPMLAGLGVVLLVFLVSREVGLVTLNWILGNFLGSVILVIVVLFQDDLRRALIKVGLPGLGTAQQEHLEYSIKEVSKAAAELSSRRLGAIIVVKREVGLEEYTEQAISIDAKVSSELLISIFLPTSPIHDGAVIIDDQRIISAGAVLPLTFNRSLSSNLGTRHRAALGLSERNDALIVVVSEESGIISLIREGKITRDLNETTLFNALHRLAVVRQQRRKRKGKRWFFSKEPGVDNSDSKESES